MTQAISGKNEAATTDAPYYVKGLALGLPAYLIGVHLWTWVFMLPTFLGGRADFRQLYTAGYMLRTGHRLQLYDYAAQLHFQNELVSHGEVALPFIRPACEALLFVPFSLLHYRTAYFAFLAMNLALLFLCFRMLRPRMGHLARIYRWLPAAMFLAFLPVAAALMQGQDSILLLTLLTAALLLLDQDRDFMAGMLVGLGLFKFQIAVPIGLLFLAWRRWRFCGGFALSAGAGTVISLLFVGIAQAEIYARSLISMGARLPAQVNQLRYPVPISLMANLHGLIAGFLEGRITPFWIQLLTIFLSGIILLTTVFAARKARPADAFLLALTASTVVSYYLLFHDLSVLLLPLALTLDRFIGAEASGDARGQRAARAATLMFVAPVCISYFPNHFYLVALPLCVFLLVLVQILLHNRTSTAGFPI